MSLNETTEPPTKKLKIEGGNKSDKKNDLPDNYDEIKKLVNLNIKLERENCLCLKKINDNREEMRKNYKKLNQICPHKWERDWSDRGHRSSKYCVWCGN